MIKAVIFDMDDTLVDWQAGPRDWEYIIRKPIMPVYEELIANNYTLPDIAQFARDYQLSSHQLWRELGPPDWHAPKYTTILGNMLAGYGIDPSAIDMTRMVDLLQWQAIEGIYVFEGVFQMLRTLKDAGMKMGLLTNMPMPIRIRDKEIAAYGLIEYLDARITSDDVGHVKPHPAPFRAVLDMLNVQAHEAVYVGDRLHDDIFGAQGVGMRAIWIENNIPAFRVPPVPVKPDAQIKQAAELPMVLDAWHPEWRSKIA